MDIDVSKITDINALKVIAYDAIAAKERAEQNLRYINGRIQELSDAQVKLPAPATDTKKK